MHLFAHSERDNAILLEQTTRVCCLFKTHLAEETRHLDETETEIAVAPISQGP